MLAARRRFRRRWPFNGTARCFRLHVPRDDEPGAGSQRSRLSRGPADDAALHVPTDAQASLESTAASKANGASEEQLAQLQLVVTKLVDGGGSRRLRQGAGDVRR